eukprot:m.179233 g.179233  ORF g.179233 m.179233 type:complete len:827 (-) comp31964_c0_seq1:91-2571(-)
MDDAIEKKLSDFCRGWFPSADEAQPVWFGARKPKFKATVQDMVFKYVDLIDDLVKRFDGEAEMVFAHWSGRQRLMACIFMDQMARNRVAIQPLAQAKVHCADVVALALAASIDADFFGGSTSTATKTLIDSGGDGPSSCPPGLACTAAELCFFSLVFRHNRQPATMTRSKQILEEALVGKFNSVVLDTDAGRSLCGRFIDETDELAKSIIAEKYIERAMTQDKPYVLNDGQFMSPLTPAQADTFNLTVLDAKCIQAARGNVSAFLEMFISFEDAMEKLEDHPTLKAMAAALVRDGIGEKHTLVLSLSGGVDSMVHAILFRLLQKKFGFGFAALHIRHTNRGDAVDEEKWVGFVAARLGLVLYSYEVEIQRPHGGLRTGVSRERYEDVTKRIRFRMYEQALALQIEAEPTRNIGLVVLGHHMDDADENRLAELGKGNLIRINGMEILSDCFGVTMYRPLLQERKKAMFDFADVTNMPYMVDSTPMWSRRGWTRRALDSFDANDQDGLLQHLQTLGELSEQLYVDLESGFSEQKPAREISMSLPVSTKSISSPSTATSSSLSSATTTTTPPSTATTTVTSSSTISSTPSSTKPKSSSAKAKTKYSSSSPQCQHAVVLIHVGDVVSSAQVVEARVKTIFTLLETVATIWNAAIEKVKAQVVNHLKKGSSDADDMEPTQTCPLQPIVVHKKKFDAGSFVFTSAIKRRLREQPALSFMHGTQAAAKSVVHIWSMISQSKDGRAVFGTLNAKCPCGWIPTVQALAIFNATLMPQLSNSATLKRTFVAACETAMQDPTYSTETTTIPTKATLPPTVMTSIPAATTTTTTASQR